MLPFRIQMGGLLVVLSMAHIACSHRISDREFSEKEEKAIAVAEAYLRERSSLPQKYEVEISKNDEGQWEVFITDLPPMPGGHRMILVDAEGNVLDFFPGE